MSDLEKAASLTKAFNKLTSEIFIFLLAYVILLSGLVAFGPQLVDALNKLLYIIPVLGVTAYLWLQQQGIVKDGKKKGIDVKAGIVTGSAQVIGIKGAKPRADLLECVEVSTFLASDKAKVIGASFADSDLEELTVIFKQLERNSQSKLVSRAKSLLKKQENTHA